VQDTLAASAEAPPLADEPTAALETCSASPAPAAADDQSEEGADAPPATPFQAVPASPAPPVLGATPTGLGLSSLPPMSPMAYMPLLSKTPAATPAGGVAADWGGVASALQAAAQVRCFPPPPLQLRSPAASPPGRVRGSSYRTFFHLRGI
jgi:hypothetical protein